MKNKNFDFNLARELSLTMDNESEIYKQEGFLGKNYAKKYKKGKFDFKKAHSGVKNLLVTPFVRKYQNDYGGKVPNDVRDAVAKSRMRAIMRRIREGEL